MGLLFRLDARSRWAVEEGGATLVGTGTTFGQNGVTFDGNGNLSYAVAGPKILRSTLTFKIKFTLGFSPDDGITRYLFNISTAAGLARTLVAKAGATNLLTISAGNTTTVLSVAYATWSAALVAGENTLIVSTTSGATSAWLNGTLIGTSATAWALQSSPTTFTIGSLYNGTSRWIGTVSALEIYGNTCTDVDEPYLRNGTLISKLDDYLVAIPGTSYYKRASDGLFVTDVDGSAGITQALMGSDGSTAAQFPKVAREAGLVRGFSFDGGDQLNLGDSDALSFTDGVNDLPFSIVALVTHTSGTTRTLISKCNGISVGEWALYYNTSGTWVFLTIDNDTGAYIGRNGSLVAGAPPFGPPVVVCATYSGSKTTSGFALYKGGNRFDGGNTFAGVYGGMRNTANLVRVGIGVTAQHSGDLVLPMIFGYELSPLQVKALGARLQRTARVA